MNKIFPRYPIYIPSKGRFNRCLTARMFNRQGVAFRLVVEPQEAEAYASVYGNDRVLVLPFRDQGSSIPARNWIKEHSISEGHERHWQLDDNIIRIDRYWKEKRIPCDPNVAFAVVEDFVDRYENIAVAGLNYDFFAVGAFPPFYLNVHVYSCFLVLNSIPHKWRGNYNEDTDLCLQVLADGWCTVLVNAFLAKKINTMKMKGGNTDTLYQGDGRLRMARSLERVWPRVVSTKRRFRRPQHIVFDSWRRFDTPLKLKPGININEMGLTNEYGMKLVQIKPIRSEKVKKLYELSQSVHGSKNREIYTE